MHCIENATTSRRQGFNIAADIVFDFLRSAIWQHTLGIDTAAPKNELIAKIAF